MFSENFVLQLLGWSFVRGQDMMVRRTCGKQQLLVAEKAAGTMGQIAPSKASSYQPVPSS